MTINQIVEQALRDYPKTRNSDRELIVKVWEIQNGRDMNPSLREFFLNAAAFPDTVTRIRRKFQEHGEYPAVKEVEEQRYNKFTEIRGTIAGSSPRQTNLGL